MTAVLKDDIYGNDSLSPDGLPGDDQSPVIVVGAGPVGFRTCHDILRFSPEQSVILFGDEPYAPYDRVKLSSYLAGDIDQLWLQGKPGSDEHLKLMLGYRVTSIDRKAHCVYDNQGNQWPYSRLVIATGSRAYIPPIHGVELANVHSFRNLIDAEQLKARTITSRHTVVIGGGLLGLEAARAMQRFNTQVTVIEQSSWLMFNQLDEEASRLLQRQMKVAGIHVLTNMRVQSIGGDDRVEFVMLTGGQTLHCDTVIIATGIKSNIELAKEAGLNTRSGVLVNDAMQTNDPLISAVGECAEHRGTVYGLIQPGLEQAAVAASVITGGKAQYKGSQLVTQLKVVDSPVYSIGEPSAEWHRREISYQDSKKGLVRKLFVNGNRLEAAIAVGDWPEFARLQEVVNEHQRVWPWQQVRFSQTGNLWSVDKELGVAAWPATATVCNCMGVTRNELSGAISKGCRDVRSLADNTGASTVCGTCRPLLQQMLGVIGVEAVRASRFLSVGAVIVLFMVLAFFVSPNLGYSESVQYAWHWDVLWRDGFIKQVSGFALLGLSAILAFLSLPKRVKPGRIKFQWGDFALWRAVHVVIGVVTVAALVAHTGLRLGHELNFLLMMTFSGLLLAGAVLSGSVGLQHQLPLSVTRAVRKWSLWTHIILLWPLPALLGFHVLKTYWY